MFTALAALRHVPICGVQVARCQPTLILFVSKSGNEIDYTNPVHTSAVLVTIQAML